MTPHIRSVNAVDLAGVADWFTSSYSDNGVNCVEVADLTRTTHHGVALRDSKNPAGPALLLTAQQFGTFITAVRAGRYDS